MTQTFKRWLQNLAQPRINSRLSRFRNRLRPSDAGGASWRPWPRPRPATASGHVFTCGGVLKEVPLLLIALRPERSRGRLSPGSVSMWGPDGTPLVMARRDQGSKVGDARLVGRARAGDQDAFAQLLRRYRGSLQGMCRRAGGHGKGPRRSPVRRDHRGHLAPARLALARRRPASSGRAPVRAASHDHHQQYLTARLGAGRRARRPPHSVSATVAPSVLSTTYNADSALLRADRVARVAARILSGRVGYGEGG